MALRQLIRHRVCCRASSIIRDKPRGTGEPGAEREMRWSHLRLCFPPGAELTRLCP